MKNVSITILVFLFAPAILQCGKLLRNNELATFVVFVAGMQGMQTGRDP
jgi:hypothetical protein